MIKRINTDGTEIEFDKLPFQSTNDVLHHMGEFLFGEKADLMELVNIQWEDERAQMWVHESGKIINLPMNSKATELYLAHKNKATKAFLIAQGSVIVGDVLILTDKDQLD